LKSKEKKHNVTVNQQKAIGGERSHLLLYLSHIKATATVHNPNEQASSIIHSQFFISGESRGLVNGRSTGAALAG